MRVERVSAPAVFCGRVISSTAAAVGRRDVHLVRLAPELPEPSGERASSSATVSDPAAAAAADV